MAEKKGGIGKVVGCVGCLAVLVIGGVLVAVVTVVGGGALVFWRSSETPTYAIPEPPPIEMVDEPAVVLPDTIEPDTEAPEMDTEAPEADTEAPAEVTTTAPRPTPAPSPVSAPSPTPSPSPAPSMARPEPAPAPAPTMTRPAPSPAPSGGSFVSVDGDGSVVLVGGGRRYSLPTTVPPGRYDIEVTFSGQEPISVDKITVREGSDATIRCNARMGVCRAR